MAFTQKNGTNAWYEDQLLTAAAPTLATDGVPLEGFDGISTVVEANSGQTLTGGGLSTYVYDPAVGAWGLFSASWSVSTSVRYSYLPLWDLFSVRPGTRFCVTATAVTVSSGTTVRVWLLGGRHRGE